ILFTIPHFFKPIGGKAEDGRAYGSTAKDPLPRLQALTACLTGLHSLFNPSRCVLDHSQKNARFLDSASPVEMEVVVCTTRGCHLLEQLPAPVHGYHHHATQAEPLLLGYECHAVLRDRLGKFDYYCYLEDDLVLHDPWFFVKLNWFDKCFGTDKLLG